MSEREHGMGKGVTTRNPREFRAGRGVNAHPGARGLVAPSPCQLFLFGPAREE
jgi:hypothetical protein